MPKTQNVHQIILGRLASLAIFPLKPGVYNFFIQMCVIFELLTKEVHTVVTMLTTRIMSLYFTVV